jgi:hypothetical protein
MELSLTMLGWEYVHGAIATEFEMLDLTNNTLYGVRGTPVLEGWALMFFPFQAINGHYVVKRGFSVSFSKKEMLLRETRQ